MLLTQSTTERAEYLREKWISEFGGHALKALVDQAMGDYPEGEAFSEPGYDLRLVLEVPYKTVPLETLGVWAHRLDKDILSFEQFIERETGESQ